MKTRTSFILLLTILGLAVFFRFYQLNEIPPGLYPDVAINANDAISALKTGNFKIFYPENNGREGLFINLIALSFAIFGVSILAIKIVPAIIGVLTVLGLYLLTKQLFNYLNSRSETIALLSSFFLAISFWHVNFSRLGFRAIMVPFFLVWSFYFLFKGLKLNQVLWFILAGLFFGLGFHTYIAFRVAPLILVPVLLIEIIRYWPRFKLLIKEHLPLGKLLKQIYIKDDWWKWDIFLITIIIVALPIGIYFLQHPQDFLGRAGQVSVFSAENPLKELFISKIKTLGMFNFWGDCNWRHNYACQPMLLWPVGILFVLGFFLNLKEVFRRKNYQSKNYFLLLTSYFLLIWFFVMLLPAILTIEGLPHALRSIGVIPVVYIFAGIGGWWIYNKLKLLILKRRGNLPSGTLAFVSGHGSAEARRAEAESEQKRVSERAALGRANVSRGSYRAFFTICILFLIVLAYAQYDKYFIDWAKHPDVKASFTQNFVNIGNYLNNLPSEIQKYVIVNESGVPVPYPDGLPMPAQTIMFITHNKPGIKYLKPEQITQFLISSSQFPTVIVPMKYDRNLFKELRQKFPQGQIEAKEGFWAFKN